MSSYSIAFYIELGKLKKTMYQANLDLGNPGIGGTQYLFLLTVKYLNRFCDKGYAILLTDRDFGFYDDEIPVDYVKDEYEAVQYCEKHSISMLTFNANVADQIDSSVFNTSVRIVLWAHNTLTKKRQNIAAITPSIEKIVCVSESQYNNMSDTPCYEKCTYINNVIPRYFYESASCTDYSKPNVIYIGSIMPQKGAHNLLEIWKSVEKKVPDAQLYIFGGANLWNPNIKMGSKGVADQYYERIIQRRLSKLKKPENVHFMGAKGWKDIDAFIKTARVGVVNPSHYMRDETFCMSAIEMAAHAIPVVSRQRYDGLATTIQHEVTGFLEEKNTDIATRIVSLILDASLCKKMGAEARKYAENFIVENEVKKWCKIVEDEKRVVRKKSKSDRESRDSKLLKHDFVLKIGFLIASGKFIHLIIDRLKKR